MRKRNIDDMAYEFDEDAENQEEDDDMIDLNRFPYYGCGFRNRKTIKRTEFSHVLNLTQPEAANRLGISVSTLKKRFKELFPEMGRWPFRSWKKDNSETPENLIMEDEKPNKRMKQKKPKMKKKNYNRTRATNMDSSFDSDENTKIDFGYSESTGQKKQEIDPRLTIKYILNDSNVEVNPQYHGFYLNSYVERMRIAMFQENRRRF